MRKTLSVFLISVFLSSPVFAADGHDSQHKAWNVFSLTQEGNQICYITSSPIKEGGNWSNRSDPYVLVTYRGEGISEVSVSSGYPYKKGSKVEVSIKDKGSFKFFTSEETPKIAWAKNVSEDKRVIKTMIKGSRLSIKGTSPKNTWSKDTYSLYGFTKAYKRMQTLCEEFEVPDISIIAPAQEKVSATDGAEG